MPGAFLLKPGAASERRSVRRRVAITGAAGRVGLSFSSWASERHDLRLLVREETDVARVAGWGETLCGDIGDRAFLDGAFEGIDTVVHLAANPHAWSTWEELLPANIVGTHHVFMAASAAGCRRVVFASSIHAVSGHAAEYGVHAADPVSPGDLYGVSKCFGEALARYMATMRGLSSIVVRIGAMSSLDNARRSIHSMDAFVSPGDLNRLLGCCIDDERVQFAIVHGLSRNRFCRLEIESARELLGYAPEDDLTEINESLAPLDLRKQVSLHNDARG